MLIAADTFPQLHPIPVELVESGVELDSPLRAVGDRIERMVVLRAHAGEELGLGPQCFAQLLVRYGFSGFPKERLHL
jgi:hypothetical protein